LGIPLFRVFACFGGPSIRSAIYLDPYIQFRLRKVPSDFNGGKNNRVTFKDICFESQKLKGLSLKNRGLWFSDISRTLIGEKVGEEDAVKYEEGRMLGFNPDPGFTPGSLPVLVPILNQPQSQSITLGRRKPLVFKRAL